ncbi:MAG: DNA recombination protein RmuC [Duncaniella sp.]|uniref:DNA recombination protein RmuC n=1 Tax=Duncaniella sp. TaxID=2518496 RepID=UPI0023CE3C1E|nr:DNA recombination protein RmuC [Duncaniella sp.]MDE6090973.1 DNA recombination protein RmuC [Duncaniella sp.]
MSVSLIFALILGIAVVLLLYFLLNANRRNEALEKENRQLSIESERMTTESRSTIAALNTSLADLRRSRDELDTRLGAMSEHLAAAREENSALHTRLELLNDEMERRESQKTEQEEKRKEQEQLLESRFRNLANDILRQNTADLKSQNEERLLEILAPLRNNIDDFRKAVTDTYNNEARERFSLSERIKELVDLNQSISRQARELSEALRGDSKVQGDWGEMVLESILERSGLQKGVEYITQVTTDSAGNALRNEDGSLLRPDVVVKYPDGRFVVIDSKVSLTAFVDYANADNDEVREGAAMRHVRSVKKHVDELARKRYQEYVGEAKLDFVMMFIPNEPAYIAAMRLDPGLWQEAYDRQVLIVSPTHLVSGLKLIAQLWSRDRHTKNAITIAEEAGKMYDKFADFTKDMERIEKALGSTRKAYDDAMTKLTTGTGNLMNRALNLQKLGVKASKQLAASVAKEASDDDKA